MAKHEPYIFGIHAVREALDAGKEIEKVLVRRGAGSDLFKQMLVDLRRRNVPVQQVPVERLNRITRKNHQGVVAWVSEITYHQIESLLPMIFEEGEEPLVLVLDGVSDVRNFGAIARTAECAGVHAIVIPASGSAAINADAMKTSAGALHRIKICRHKDLAGILKFMKNSGLKIVAATERAEDNMYASELSGPLALVMGSEERGVSAPLLKDADQWISIPMKGKIASLNVSVAAGILVYEAIRQRRS